MFQYYKGLGENLAWLTLGVWGGGGGHNYGKNMATITSMCVCANPNTKMF